MLPNELNYNDFIAQTFRDEIKDKVATFTITFQVTEDCSLRCSYCYQPTKVKKYMTFDVAKKAIDKLLDEAENNPDSIISYNRVFAMIFDFIGGEPFLNIDLMEQIVDYIEQQLFIRKSPWLYHHHYSISSNGVSYFDKKVQNFLNKYNKVVSTAITVDGCKELHDKCRLFPTGEGSYDKAIAAALDLKERHHNHGTKITISPDNLEYLLPAIQNMLNLGFYQINANVVFEDVWKRTDAQRFYWVLKDIADYLLDSGWDEKCYLALFVDNYFQPYTDDHDQNWCGGTGAMLAIDCDGNFYPCVRYLPNSLNFCQKPYTVGNLITGPYNTPQDKETRVFLESIKRSTQSTEECNKCPIGQGCAWCSGYNYQCFGTPNKRATFICDTHKARALANLYFWKKEAKKYNKTCKFQNHITDEIALQIIPPDEWEMLKQL